MDKSDIASNSGSDMRKKLKLDDSVDEEEYSEEYSEEDSEEDEEKEGYNAMAEMFINTGLNPNILKTPSFAKLMRFRNPNLPLSVPPVEKEILEIHQVGKEKAKKFLKAFQGKVTLSYEWFKWGWIIDVKGPVLHEDFTCIAAHFIDDNWKVRKWILGYVTDDSMILLDGTYPDHLKTAVQGFEIANKVSTILLPNLEDLYEDTVDDIWKYIQEKGNPPGFLIYCCADLFRLMVGSLFSELSSSLIDDVRMLVGWGHSSSYFWNVHLFHLQQAVDLKTEDAFSKDEVYDEYDKPSDEEWIKIETFCKLAGCIYKVAKVLFEGEYSTSNVYFHLLAELKVMLNQELANADNDYFRGKTKGILKRFDKYWNDMFLVLATASVLDPRFKAKYVEFYCSKKKDNDEGSKAETVLDYLRSLYARYAASDIYQKPICPDPTIKYEEEEKEEKEEEEEEEEDEEDDEEDNSAYKELCEKEKKERQVRKEKEENARIQAYKDFVVFQEFLKFEGSSRESQESELDSYLKEPVMEWNKDFKVLEWWKEESQKYPILSRVARDILSIPISRATSYDVYNPNKREPPEFVLSLKPEIANAMMCSKSWLRL